MEGGAFQSKKLAKASLDYLFVFLHQTREDSRASYDLIVREYLHDDFLHPIYFFLRPDGTEADPKNRHSHVALGPQQIQKILDRIQKEWGRGLGAEDYEAALASFAKAEAHLAAGEKKEGVRLLEGIAKLRARCGIKDRAAARLKEIETLERLLEAWRALEGVPETLAARVEKPLVDGDLVASFQALRAARPEPSEPAGKFLDGVVETLRDFIRLRPVQVEEYFIGDRTYYHLRAEWETGLRSFDGLGLQIGYLTDAPRSLEGWAIFDEVAPYRHHRASCSLTSTDFRLRDLVNARAQLWLGDFLLHESLWKESPTEFPEEKSHVQFGPDLLGADQSLGTNYRATLRKYEAGRYPAGRQ